jgi:hypothetical protein
LPRRTVPRKAASIGNFRDGITQFGDAGIVARIGLRYRPRQRVLVSVV